MKFIELETAQKLRGGYYTPKKLASFICEWIIAANPQAILEPSCGDGIFFKGLSETGISKDAYIHGFEILDEEAQKSENILKRNSFSNYNIQTYDFLKWIIQNIHLESKFDAVVGNPPFIRYQYLSSETQSYIEAIFKYLNLKFTKHTNLWVPFILAAIKLLKPGGRLGMIIPSEILHVIHAQSLRNFLGKTCNRILIFDPEEIWFEKTLQGAVIILAEKKTDQKKSADGLGIIKINGDNFIKTHPQKYFFTANYLNGKTIEGKWTYALLTNEEYALLNKIIMNKDVHCFKDIAEVDVGIVTGANKFFLVSNDTVDRFNLHKFAYPMFGRSEHCPGIIYDQKQHHKNVKKGYPTNFLWFNVNSTDELSDLHREYILLGEKSKLNKRYKCKVRSPWFKVPSVYSTEIGMLKRSHDFPRLIFNEMKAFTTDTAYRIRIKKFEGQLLVYSFLNSLTALSAELEGRHYGGGVLELVPSEIEKLLIPIPQNIRINLRTLNNLFYTKDSNILFNQDSDILPSIGLSKKEINILQNAWQRLKQRRQRQREKDISTTLFQ